jgi:hypothetical protein
MTDPFSGPTTAYRLLLARCSDCFRPVGRLCVDQDPHGSGVDQVLPAAYWDTTTSRRRCPHSKPLPPPAELRSHVAAAITKGITLLGDAPVTIRV